MFTLIPQSRYRPMPWKSGRGTTAEILVSPGGASLAALDFDYRLSMAPICEDGPFSPFPGFSRILLPIKGAGFVLNGHPYATYEIAHFDGSEPTHCALLKKEVTDLGLIYDPARIKANARVLNLPFSLSLTLEPANTYLVVLLDGTLEAGGHELQSGDTLSISGEPALALTCQKRATLAFFTLQPCG